ncbi:hypothetical protein LUZ60_008048 [Juncus effusus]|nr:hypothetical protein LUZ60_008048 [Juncus effusus]
MKAPNFLFQNPPFLSFLLLALLTLTFLFVYPSKFVLQSFLATCPSTNSTTSHFDNSLAKTTINPNLRILIGILTVANNYERRHLIRLAYSRQSNNYFDADVDIRFVFCSLSNEEQAVLVALEIMEYNDIIILNCTENMDNGKTYTYFSSVPALFHDDPYDYVMKCDDDTYLRLDNLVESLRIKPREDVYYGLINPCYRADDMDYRMNMSYMSGLGYVLSWDLAEWIAVSDIPRHNIVGLEDKVLGSWLNTAMKGRNRYHNFPAIYDYQLENWGESCAMHGFIPETIAVHLLKGNSEWAKTLKYFNVTKGLKPSKLYDIS